MKSIQEVLKTGQNRFVDFVDKIEAEKLNDVAIRRAIKNYDVKNLKIANVTPLRAKKMYQTLFVKYQQTQTYANCWLENQRRLFVFALICYLHKNSIQISSLTTDDFDFFHALFPLKDLHLIKFQAFSIVKKEMKGLKWTEEEDELLVSIIQKNCEKEQIPEWGNVSKEFFFNSGEKCFRSSKQCRERWQNHLDPNKIKGRWELEQEITLFKEVLNIGRKWSKIAEKLNGKKNEHMVKNRYKSMIHKVEKELKGKKMNEDELIEIIIKRLEKRICEGSSNQQNSSLQQKCNNNQSEQMEKEEEFDQVHEDLNIISAKIPQLKSFQSIKSLDKSNSCQKRLEKTQDLKEIFDQDALENVPIAKKSSCHVLVEPMQDFGKEIKEEECEFEFEDRNLENVSGHINLSGEFNFGSGFNKLENEIMGRVIRDPTPTPQPQNNHRFASLMMDPRSPANFMVSPFPWTPTIFFVQDPQGQVSPQVGFSNFCSKFTNEFYKFVGDNNNENEERS